MIASIAKLKKSQLVVDENATHVEELEMNDAGEQICNMLKFNEDGSFTTLARNRVFESRNVLINLCTTEKFVFSEDYIIDGVN